MHKRGRGSRSALGKKGYFFIVDAFVGSLIIFFSLFMILGSKDNSPKLDTNYELAEGYASFLINTKIEDYNNVNVTYMINNGYITNSKNSLMQQAYLFYKNYKEDNITYPNGLSNATLLITQTKDIVPSKFSFSVTIKDNHGSTEIYSRGIYDINTVKQVIASKKIVYVNKDASTIYGPDVMIIKVWT